MKSVTIFRTFSDVIEIPDDLPIVDSVVSDYLDEHQLWPRPEGMKELIDNFHVYGHASSKDGPA